ncbi:MAG: 23S rRNA (uracil(1939)-C(5))-methyltransferase RlmD [Erysipelotrichaceae bacterium]|nr:23S rRNA (uracil(1939)-C(5))-methyltransferase RlmD [Erysipelotrichaceae bacterium]
MKNDLVTCSCRDYTIDGYGIAEYEGLVLFVKGLLLNEKAIVKIISHKKNLAYAIIDRILEPSPYRTKTPCPVAYKCGSCDLQHMNYEGQLLFKKRLEENTFRQAHLNVEIADVTGAEVPWRYRDKIQIPVRDHLFGYYRRFSNDIVEQADCLLHSEKENDIVAFLKDELIHRGIDKDLRHLVVKEGYYSGEIMVCFVTKKDIAKELEAVVKKLVSAFPEIVSVLENIHPQENNVILAHGEKLLYGRNYITDKIGDLTFQISLHSFYQINVRQTEKLYAKVRELAGLKGEERILDLYCGIGTIGLSLARYAKSLTGIEIVPEAIENAKQNASINDIKNAEFICSDAKDNLSNYLKDKDLVIVDPPRKGLSSEVVTALNTSGIDRIIYVSCNPATLVRDLVLLSENYSFKKVYPFDLFPQTTHIETIVLLQRQNS